MRVAKFRYYLRRFLSTEALIRTLLFDRAYDTDCQAVTRRPHRTTDRRDIRSAICGICDPPILGASLYKEESMFATLRWIIRVIVVAGLIVGLRARPASAEGGCYYCMACGGGAFACCINDTFVGGNCDVDGPGYAHCVSDVDGCYMDSPCQCADEL
jgi:hypothetical protein